MSRKSKKTKLLVVLGPTSSGKSKLSVALALKFRGEVISADSRQVYRNLDIGTGKITKKEMKGVRHHLLDAVSPQKRFSASDFVSLASKAIEDIKSRCKLPIICGGTGFYIDALLGEKKIPEVPPNLALRKKLERKTNKELFEILKKLDPERAHSIDRNNPRRLVRAIEICRALGKVPPLRQCSAGQATSEARSMNYEVCKIGIKIPDMELKKRIISRLAKRVKQGMIAETKRLHEAGLSYKRMRELGLEYGALADLLQNKISKEEMTERLQNEIWHYAKRQMTWFRKDKNIVWIEPKIKSAEKVLKNFIQKTAYP
jgi:tRNA dimethylallyltransferase